MLSVAVSSSTEHTVRGETAFGFRQKRRSDAVPAIRCEHVHRNNVALALVMRGDAEVLQ